MGSLIFNLYLITSDRNIGTVEKFLFAYSNRQDVENEEYLIKIEDFGGSLENSLITNTNKNEFKAKNLTEAISIGLSAPDVCFQITVLANQIFLMNISLCFTKDNHLVLGLTITDYLSNEEIKDGLKFAQEYQNTFQMEFNGMDSYIAFQEEPPLSLNEFYSEKKFWTINSNSR